MKKALVATVVALIMLGGFSSCKRCQVCKRSSSDEIRVCEKDYDNNTLYGLALDGYELQGYDCKNGL